MNLRDLKYLVAVAELKHFGRAAKACFVSQPSLSTQIKKLEEELDVQLIERSKKRVLVTPVGEQVVQHAKQMLQHQEDIRIIAKSYNDPFTADLKIGVIPTVAPYWLPSALSIIQDACPKLSLKITESQTKHLLEKLTAGVLDVLVLALPVPMLQFDSVELFDEPFLVALSQSHPLARRQYVSQEDIVGESVMLLEDGHCLRDQALDICQSMGVSEQEDLSATSLETLRQLVANNHGITFMPEMAIPKMDRDIVYRPFKGQAPQRTIGLVWRTSTAKRAVIEKLAEVLKA